MSDDHRVPVVKICDLFIEQAKVLAESVWRIDEAERRLENAKNTLAKFLPYEEVEKLVATLRVPRYSCTKCCSLFVAKDFSMERGLCFRCGDTND